MEIELNIRETLVKILNERFSIPKEKLKAEYFDEPLTGKFYGLKGIELVSILFEMEKQFQIRAETENIGEYGFSNIHGIIKACEKAYYKK